jgi:hypothetical protein
LDPDLPSEEGIKGGLTLLIDSSRERSVEARVSTMPTKMDTDHMYLNREIKQVETTAKIYIPTISSYTGLQPGTYKMSYLKRMMGTSNFLKMSEAKKKCQNEPVEKCSTREALARGRKACGCLPWTLTSVLSNEVIGILSNNIPFSSTLVNLWFKPLRCSLNYFADIFCVHALLQRLFHEECGAGRRLHRVLPGALR